MPENDFFFEYADATKTSIQVSTTMSGSGLVRLVELVENNEQSHMVLVDQLWTVCKVKIMIY